MNQPTQPDVIGELAKAGAEAGADDGGAAMHKLWQAVMLLDEWHFMSTPIDEDDKDLGNPQPLIGTLPESPDQRMLFAYTDSKRAFDASVALGSHSPKDPIPTIALKRDAAAKYAHDLIEHGVWGILFNQCKDDQGFFAPLTNIVPMFEYHLGFVLPGLGETRPAPNFDAIARVYKQTHVEHALHAYLRCLFHLKSWFFVSDQTNPDAPMLWTFGGELAIVGFTNPNRAAHAAEKMGILDEEGCANIIEMSPPETKEIFDTARQHGIHRIIFNASSEPMPFETEALQSVMDGK